MRVVITSWADTMRNGKLYAEWREERKSYKAAWKLVDMSDVDRKNVRIKKTQDGQTVFFDVMPEGLA